MANSSGDKKTKIEVIYTSERLSSYKRGADFMRNMVMLVDSPEGIDFYPNACHQCRAYGGNVKLKRCGNCQAIAYCNKEHQTQHWPEHKNICRVLTKLIKDGDKRFKVDPFSKDPHESWFRARMSLIEFAGFRLDNRLSHVEMDMLMFPRSCEICHETDPSKLTDCTECPNGSFCIKHPRESSHHFARCETLKFCFETNAVLSKPVHVPLVPNYGESVPNNMDQVINVYLKHHDLDKTYKSPNIWAALLSEQLTRPYTFLFAMEKLSRPKMRNMEIHVVDTERKEMEKVHLWENLFHHNEILEELKLVFVGPELSPDPVTIKLCERCKKNKRKINIQCVRDFYPTFAGGDFFTRPNYVVGFVLGIGFGPHSLIWDQTLDILAVLGCPFFITSRCAEESKADKIYIDAQFEAKVEFYWTGKNPFSSLLPHRDLECNDFFYVNQYLTIYEKVLPPAS